MQATLTTVNTYLEQYVRYHNSFLPNTESEEVVDSIGILVEFFHGGQ